MKKGDGYYLDEFGHTHSEDYLAVTIRYDAQEQLRTLVLIKILKHAQQMFL